VFGDELNTGIKNVEQFKTKVEKLIKDLENGIVRKGQAILVDVGKEYAEEVNEIVNSAVEAGAQEKRLEQQNKNVETSKEKYIKTVEEMKAANEKITFEDKLIAGAQAITAFTSVVTTLKGT
jgi:hypothetical protein